MAQHLTKKIISGKYKGKTLKLPSMSTTRSSKSIVLESFFNTIQFDVIDANFVELFSGSGWPYVGKSHDAVLDSDDANGKAPDISRIEKSQGKAFFASVFFLEPGVGDRF